jgi:hypothetical protein
MPTPCERQRRPVTDLPNQNGTWAVDPFIFFRVAEFSKISSAPLPLIKAQYGGLMERFPLLPNKPGKAATTGLAFDADIAPHAAVCDRTGLPTRAAGTSVN